MAQDMEQAGGADAGKKTFFRRRKSCPFSGPNGLPIDWKDPKMLGKFISERGKMMPSRITAVSMKKQRETGASHQTGAFYGPVAVCAYQIRTPRIP